MQNQINPHFLYNTLEGIRAEAVISGVDTIAEMTEALATYFRYTISQVDNLVTLEEELANVENYYYIQKFRFGDRLDLMIRYDCEDEYSVLQCQIPADASADCGKFYLPWSGTENGKRSSGYQNNCYRPTLDYYGIR